MGFIKRVELKMYKVIVLVCLGLLFGCTSVEQSTTSAKCSGENWKELGAQAAKKFQSVRSFDEYIDACGSSLEPTAKSAFVDGYARALIEVCNYESGFSLGSTNQKYPDICPFEIQAEIQKGYLAGRRDFQDKMLRLNESSENLDEIERNQRSIDQIRKAN
jgi:Protein of unknown function (DUF2799)